jgi:Zn-dependent metalloprotease
MCSRTHRHSIFCILPPHVLREVARNGAKHQREAALRTLAHDQTFRSVRVVPAPAAPTVLAAPAVKQRTIYDAGSTETLPGRAVRNEGEGPSADAAVNEAYDGLGATWDFYHDLFGRNSIDDHGLKLDATVHYGQAYDNAFWNGRQMVFGDGDGRLFNRFTISLDVIGHELTHGVTENEVGLRYLESGALNESVSDVFGSLIKQRVLNQTADQADWLIGAGLLAKGVDGVALRSMKAPGTAYDDKVLGKDPQPATMADFVHTNQDNGGVHVNSGIPNHAFYLAAVAIGGFAWEKAGRIWYETLRDPRLHALAGFRRFAQLSVEQAGRLFGASGIEQKAVEHAWQEVGVLGA